MRIKRILSTMIEELKISNFQSHKKSVLEFDKGVNIIIGQSDSGKTAILRALNWVINNKPSGDSFRSHWGGETTVRIDNIYRTKGKTKNVYTIVDDVGETDFKSFGQDVPNDIKKILNLSTLNFQGQFSSPFLLGDSSGEVARYLNKIVKLDSIDSSVKNINRTLQEQKNLLTITKTNIKDYKEKQEEYDWLEEAEEELKIIEAERKKSVKRKKQINSLSDIIESLQEVEKEIKKQTPTKQMKMDLEYCIDSSEELTVGLNLIGRLNGIITNYKTKKEKYEKIKLELIELKRKQEKLTPKKCPLCGAIKN